MGAGGGPTEEDQDPDGYPTADRVTISSPVTIADVRAEKEGGKRTGNGRAEPFDVVHRTWITVERHVRQADPARAEGVRRIRSGGKQKENIFQFSSRTSDDEMSHDDRREEVD